MPANNHQDDTATQPIAQPINGITDVRTVLFDTLRALSSKENPMELDRAKEINEVAQTLINSAKVEIDALRVIGGSGSGFIQALPPVKPGQKPALGEPQRPGITHPQPGVTRHTL